MREYRYLLLDVFTDEPLLGNQLAVFPDAAGLSDAEMRALALETNLSETTFCFPAEGAPEHGVKVRIFTTEEELPFAGHPTLGTATALRWTLPALREAAEVTLRLAAGDVPVRFRRSEIADGGKEGGDALPFGQPVEAEMEQPLPRFGRQHDRAEVAVALGLPLEALDPEKPVQTISTGLPFTVVPLTSEEALRGLAIPPDTAKRYLSETEGRFFYVIAPGARPLEWRARMQFYHGEDPATGSAAGCAAAYLVHHGYAPAGQGLLIEQGVEMGRRSLLQVSALLHSDSGAVGDRKWAEGSYVRVGGCTLLVAEGRFFLS